MVLDEGASDNIRAEDMDCLGGCALPLGVLEGLLGKLGRWGWEGRMGWWPLCKTHQDSRQLPPAPQM